MAACHRLGYAKRTRVADEQVNPEGTRAHWPRASVCGKDTPDAQAPDDIGINAATKTVATEVQRPALTTD